MDFINQTEFPAKFLSGSMGESEMLGIIATKVTYDASNNELLPIMSEEVWPVFEKPFLYNDVDLGVDLDFRKNGIDLFVFGKAVAPARKPVKRMRVGIEWGKLLYQAEIIGDRFWKKSFFGMKISEPLPFIEMDLTNDRVFGGKTRQQGIEVIHGANPDGKGYVLLKEEVKDTPLPNIERPESIIKKWQDQPHPACLFKPAGVILDEKILAENPEAIPHWLIDTSFNKTVADLVVDPRDYAPSLLLHGFSADGTMQFSAPPLHGPTAKAQVGELAGEYPSTLSSLIVFAEEKIIIATYLCLFRYFLNPLEKRNVVLNWDAGAVPVAGGKHIGSYT